MGTLLAALCLFASGWLAHWAWCWTWHSDALAFHRRVCVPRLEAEFDEMSRRGREEMSKRIAREA